MSLWALPVNDAMQLKAESYLDFSLKIKKENKTKSDGAGSGESLAEEAQK